jgi:hypothetical protein
MASRLACSRSGGEGEGPVGGLGIAERTPHLNE